MSLEQEILAEKQAIKEEERILNRRKIELYIKQLYEFFRDEQPIAFDAAAIAGITADLSNAVARCESAASIVCGR